MTDYDDVHAAQDMDTRQRLLDRLTDWVDQSLADETMPEGWVEEMLREMDGSHPDAPDGPDTRDFFQVWSALTAMVQEVKLQGRAFQRLSETLEPLAALEPATRSALAAYGEMSEALRRQTRRDVSREFLDVLIDVRDRLARMVTTAEASRKDAGGQPGAFRRFFGAILGWNRAGRRAGSALENLEMGARLTLERLDEQLGRMQVREILCQGKMVDPRMMKVIDVVEDETAPDGSVVEVYRSGYVWEGAVFRPAEVKAARKRSPRIQQGDSDNG